ncbi:MAG: uroporphyrinogen decarboxylase family protein [Armatimonadia bacterium]
MTGKERINAAMNLQQPDRVPVMCQLSIGHYLVNCGVSAADYWLHNDVIVDCFVKLAERYRFDGILINLPGRTPAVDEQVESIEETREGQLIRWKRGGRCLCPADDLPHELKQQRVSLEELEPEKLFYDDPHTLGGLKYPFYYDLEPYEWSEEGLFPAYHTAIIEGVMARVGDRLSVHGEVFSPFTQLMERLGYENGLMALLTDADKCHAILERFAAGAGALAKRQGACGVDAVLISSAFAGGGFISKKMYEQFVLPYEKLVVAAIHGAGCKAYTHTCGAIGDRLELMEATGIDGIDTMDPPPLGDTELADAKQRVGGRIFLKGNIDSVNVLLKGTAEQCRQSARERIAAASAGGGYILSSACSVAPHVPAENILALVEVAEEEK